MMIWMFWGASQFLSSQKKKVCWHLDPYQIRLRKRSYFIEIYLIWDYSFIFRQYSRHRPISNRNSRPQVASLRQLKSVPNPCESSTSILVSPNLHKFKNKDTGFTNTESCFSRTSHERLYEYFSLKMKKKLKFVFVNFVEGWGHAPESFGRRDSAAHPPETNLIPLARMAEISHAHIDCCFKLVLVHFKFWVNSPTTPNFVIFLNFF